ncbi:MAG: hypothetical protein IPG59_16930 [Candidatus Melainabacteria bacterium]|nr:MAG: hypothetical protein IPG59_16930 [Candidatus Melainabacteria bacterium]
MLARKLKGIFLAFIILFMQFGILNKPAAALDRIQLEGQAVALTPGAREAANLLGILPKVERLLQLKQQRQGNETAPLSDEELGLKVDVLDKVLGASMEVRMVSGRIDRDLSWAFAGQGALNAKQQKILNTIFTVNFMQIGTLGVLSGPAFLNGRGALGSELLLLASSIGLVLSMLAFAQTNIGYKKAVDGDATILTDVLKVQKPVSTEHESKLVVKFLDSVPPGTRDGKTRSQALIENWKKGKYLRNMSEPNLKKLSAVVPSGKKYKIGAAEFNKRIRMLFDTQYTIELFHEQLVELLRAAEIS